MNSVSLMPRISSKENQINKNLKRNIWDIINPNQVGTKVGTDTKKVGTKVGTDTKKVGTKVGTDTKKVGTKD